MPAVPEITADFIYIRWIGKRQTGTGTQNRKADRLRDLKLWAHTIKELGDEVRRIYGFFNDDYSGHSPTDVNQLKDLLGIRTVEPSTLWPPQPRMP